MRRALLLVALMTPAELLAEQPTETAVAREQFNRGVAAAKENRWDEAYDAFSRSYALTKKTSILFNLAGAEVKTGRWVEARETYRRFLNEVDPSQKKAKAEAQRLLATLESQIPRVVISLEDPAPEDTIALDGNELVRALLGIELPLNPGRHQLVRSRAGTEIAREELEIGAKERREIRLPGPQIAVEPPPAVAPPTPIADVRPEPPAEEESSFFAGPWIWIIAGAVVVAGGVAAGVALANRGDEPYAGTTGIVLRGLDP